MTEPTTPDDITAAVLASFDKCPDERLRTVMRSLTAHLHAFVKDVALTEEEWRAAISILTASGHITSGKRQEWILWSDALGVSMLVDAISNRTPDGATESTVQGPFYVPGSPQRAYGERIDEMPAGEPLWVHGSVRSLDGRPLAGAELDVWQNGDNELYAVQDPEAPEDHLRGRFTARNDGTYGFVTVRPSPYPIPYDGPVGHMLEAVGRSPYRAPHLHFLVTHPTMRTLITHIFVDGDPLLDSDAVFGVRPSLIRDFARQKPGTPTPDGRDLGSHSWTRARFDIVLAPDPARD